jgi:molybdenum cofactor cytidylyltransferase
MHRVAAVVLAAGGSTRMGSPKQLLLLDGESLVHRAAKTALASRCAAVFVVVGAHAAAVTREVDGLALTVGKNRRWRDGIGSSISIGVEALAAAQPTFAAALITLADQPGVTPELLDRLVAASETAPTGLVACEYAGTVGVPALFGARYFCALCELNEDRGAKGVLSAHANVVVRIPFPPAAIDIDTRDDYERVSSRVRHGGAHAVWRERDLP